MQQRGLYVKKATADCLQLREFPKFGSRAEESDWQHAGAPGRQYLLLEIPLPYTVIFLLKSSCFIFVLDI